MKRSICLLGVIALAAGAAQGAVITFSDLNTAASGNAANVGGSQDNLTVTRAGTGAAGSGYLYSVTYANESYDGDATLDTVTFDVRVKGLSGGSATTGLSGTNANGSDGSATVGTTDAAILLTTKSSQETWTVGDAYQQVGESFAISLENFSVTTSVGSYSASLNNFTVIQTVEGGGHTHPYVIGAGSGLQARHWSNNVESQDTMTLNPTQSPTLYITAASGGAINENWGLKDVAFGVEVIPEPATLGLIAFMGGGLLFIRRFIQM